VTGNFPVRQPSNGVPWLEWSGRHAWRCLACGRSGCLPAMTTVREFARFLGDAKREHARCRPASELEFGSGVGHPLNPDRAEAS
jgi:hypothetical protein